MFRCAKHAKDRMSCTHNHFIYYDDLFNEIAIQLSLQIEKLINSNAYVELYEKIMIDISHRAQKIITNSLQNKLQTVNKKIRDKFKSFSGKINTNELDSLYNFRRSLLEKIAKPRSDLSLIINDQSNNIKKMIKEYLSQTLINQNTLNLLIEKIEIGHLENSSDKRVQVIKVHYRF